MEKSYTKVIFFPVSVDYKDTMRKIRSLAELEVFRTVARLGSFSAASKSLALTKSAVGKSIARMEEKFDGPLFFRKNGRQQPTALGHRLLTASDRILFEADYLEGYVSDGGEEINGSLSINIPISFGRRCLLEPLISFGRRYPNIDLEVSFSDRFVDISEEPYDLCVRLGDQVEEHAATVIDVGAQHYGLYASPGYISDRGTISGRNDIARHSFIVFGRGLTHSSLEFKINGKRFHEAIRPKYIFGEGESMLEATVQGLGVAKLPDWLCKDAVDAGNLIQLCDGWVFDPRPIRIVLPKNKPRPTATNLLIEKLERSLSNPLCGKQ